MATRLRAEQARTIADAEAKVAAATRTLDEAKANRQSVRARYVDRVPLGIAVTAGGVTIKRRRQTSGDSFSLAGYLTKNKLTAAMRPFVSRGTPYEVWDVRPAAKA